MSVHDERRTREATTTTTALAASVATSAALGLTTVPAPHPISDPQSALALRRRPRRD
jgi:hypothetical protein